MVREPELGNNGGNLWAFWLHTPPSSCLASSNVCLGMAVLVRALEDLPAAITAAEDIISQSGKTHTHQKQHRGAPRRFLLLKSVLWGVPMYFKDLSHISNVLGVTPPSGAICINDLKQSEPSLQGMSDAAIGDTERGTLHVIVTKDDESALRLSETARAAMPAEPAKVANYLHGTDDSNFTNPGAVAAAVTAQVRAVTPELLEAGKNLGRLAIACVNRKSRKAVRMSLLW